MFKRKIYDKLVRWKTESDGETAVLIDGARRVGKSTVAETFGKNEYARHIIVDFAHPKSAVIDVIRNDPGNLDRFFKTLEYEYRVKLVNRNSLIVFDEVQLCPEARQMIKYLVADNRYDYLETGSLVSIEENVANIVVPSEEEHLDMYPMDFEEFLWAQGDEVTVPFLRDAFDRRQPLGASAHNTALARFREYMLVGGMPQSVAAFLETRSFEKSDRRKRGILELYREGIFKHAGKHALRVRAVFDGVPAQLSRKEKKYRLSSLGQDARHRDYEDAFLWLDDARIVLPCYNATDPQVGLALSADVATVKLYSSDVGLLVTQALRDESVTGQDLYREIYLGQIGINEGMFAENYVAQALRMSGRELFFYSRYDMEKKENRMEIDFLIRRSGKICPVEVKSSRYATHASLDKFRSKFGDRLGESFLLCAKDLQVKDGIVHLPLYMAMFL